MTSSAVKPVAGANDTPEALVSVITPTWQRHDVLISRCVPSVFQQNFAAVEHVVVSDGPDRDLEQLLATDLWRRPRKTRPLVVDTLSKHLDGPIDYGSRARNRGLELASGQYVAYLDDDNAHRPWHLRNLVALLERTGADFAYSQMHVHWDGGDYTIGAEPPAYGQIDTSLLIHRAGIPQKYGMWPLPGEIAGDKHAPDWGVVERWLQAGATWAHLPQVTVDYYRT